jgi:hypothetical protein
MRRNTILLLSFFLIAGVAWLQVLPPRDRPLSELIPAGALLSIEAKDFGAQLADWNRSQVKAKWLLSQNYDAFAQSNLFTKINNVFAEYTSASGFVPGLPQVLEVEGTESALALYDPRELQFLYITRLPNAQLMKSQLWAQRDKFESRESAGKTFYLRGTGRRTVAFAFSGDYLFVATRDDLIAHALALQSGTQSLRLADEQWYAAATKSSAGKGDLRMVLNLTALVKNTYFRSYWIQRNVSQLRPFTAEVCDLDRKGTEFIERRVFVRDPDSHPVLAPESSRTALGQLVSAAPRDAGLYRAWADPDPHELASLIEQTLLFPSVQGASDARYAPPAPDESTAGSDADLETRIDREPLALTPENNAGGLLQALLAPLKLEAAIQIQSSATPAGSSFMSTPSVIAIAATADWDAARVRATLTSALSSRISANDIGLQWTPAGPQAFKIDGLTRLWVTARGHTIYIANSNALLTAVLAQPSPVPSPGTDTYAASFRHGRERSPYLALMRALDSSSPTLARFGVASPNQPAFFSSNIASLDDALSGIQTIDISEQALPDRVQQTVHYF